MLDSLSAEELIFIKAIEKFKAENNKQFLSWTEVLKVVKGLGYRKVPPRRSPATSGAGRKKES